MVIPTTLTAIDQASLMPPVTRLLGREAIELDDWQPEVLHGGMAATSAGVYRLRGVARDRGECLPWSLILKIVREVPGWGGASVDPQQAWGYWQREARAYQSGLFDDLPAGLATPRCYGIAEQPEVIWLWLEDVGDGQDRQWLLARYGLAAQQFGVFNGLSLTTRPVPDLPWLSRGGLRAWCDTYAPRLAPLAEVHAHPDLARFWPGDLADRTRRLVAQRAHLLDALDQLPQVLGHGDALRTNLLSRRRADGCEETVVIDWAFLGHFAIGQEMAQLVVGSTIFYATDVADLPDLDQFVFEQYLAGLRAAGWRGDPRLVRLGYAIDAALRHSVLPHGVTWPSAEGRLRAEQAMGHPYEEVLERFQVIRRYLLDRADEAETLLSTL